MKIASIPTPLLHESAERLARVLASIRPEPGPDEPELRAAVLRIEVDLAYIAAEIERRAAAPVGADFPLVLGRRYPLVQASHIRLAQEVDRALRLRESKQSDRRFSAEPITGFGRL